MANMSKRISATDAKNNFGGLLEDVAALGRVEIVKHGRLVAVIFSPQALTRAMGEGERSDARASGEQHMIPPERAAAARVLRPSRGFDEE
jgi:prevent-host-death family protein